MYVSTCICVHCVYIKNTKRNERKPIAEADSTVCVLLHMRVKFSYLWSSALSTPAPNKPVEVHRLKMQSKLQPCLDRSAGYHPYTGCSLLCPRTAHVPAPSPASFMFLSKLRLEPLGLRVEGQQCRLRYRRPLEPSKYYVTRNCIQNTWWSSNASKKSPAATWSQYSPLTFVFASTRSWDSLLLPKP